MKATDDFIERYKTDYVREFFNDNAMLWNCVWEARDYGKIQKLLTIKTLDDFWNKVRQFTKNVYSDHSIHSWQCLAELREIQLDLQQNYYYDNNKNEILKKE